MMFDADPAGSRFEALMRRLAPGWDCKRAIQYTEPMTGDTIMALELTARIDVMSVRAARNPYDFLANLAIAPPRLPTYRGVRFRPGRRRFRP